MHAIGTILLKHKGKRAYINPSESQHYGLMIIDIEPLKPPERSVSLIEDVVDDLLVLNYYDAKELHYIPLDKIIKVNVVLRES